MEKKVHLGNGTCGYFRPGTPALVLLHGMCGSSDHFLGAFDSSALAPFGLLAVDIPGFGDSPAVSDPPSLDRIAAAVSAAIQANLQDRPRCIVAHSFSAVLADRIAGGTSPIALLEGNLVDEHLDFSTRILSIERAQFADEFARMQRAAHMIMRSQIRAALSDAHLRRYAASWQRCSATTVWDLARICSEEVCSGASLAAYAAIQQLLCLYGAGSRYGDSVVRIRTALPQAEIAEIQRAGHYPWLDDGAATWQAVAAFADIALAKRD